VRHDLGALRLVHRQQQEVVEEAFTRIRGKVSRQQLDGNDAESC
jgi:hypothetical protein